MRPSLFLAAPVVVLLLAPPAFAADYYVATDGDDDAPGTLDQPFLTVERAQEAAGPGDTVFIRGGVYAFSGTSRTYGVRFDKSGTPEQRIQYFAYPGETPIFDLFELTPNERVTGLDVNCDYVHLRGLEVRGVRQIVVGDSWSVRIRGDGNIIENLNVHHGEAPGIFITSGGDNQILNCDSHHNYDPLEDGGNADGFGCHSSGSNNLFSGCRAYENSDDGFDFISAEGTCIAERSWAFRNGWEPDTETGAGNGAGFKSGGYGLDTGSFPDVPARHVVRFNVAFGNRSQGFYANHHPGGIDFINNTAFDNATNFDMLADVGESSHTLRNNVALEPGGDVARLTGGTDDYNSWTLPVTVSAEDFQNLDTAEALAARASDGSLPAMGFLRLAANSDLIDRGEDVGYEFNDAAPDLGAFESGAPATGGGGGGSSGAGAGGSAGSAGAATAGSGGTGASAGAMNGGAPGNAAGGSSSGGSMSSGSPGAASPGSPATSDGACTCRVGRPPGRESVLTALLAALCAVTLGRWRSGRPHERSAVELRDHRG